MLEYEGALLLSREADDVAPHTLRQLSVGGRSGEGDLPGIK